MVSFARVGWLSKYEKARNVKFPPQSRKTMLNFEDPKPRLISGMFRRFLKSGLQKGKDTGKPPPPASKPSETDWGGRLNGLLMPFESLFLYWCIYMMNQWYINNVRMYIYYIYIYINSYNTIYVICILFPFCRVSKYLPSMAFLVDFGTMLDVSQDIGRSQKQQHTAVSSTFCLRHRMLFLVVTLGPRLPNIAMKFKNDATPRLTWTLFGVYLAHLAKWIDSILL